MNDKKTLESFSDRVTGLATRRPVAVSVIMTVSLVVLRDGISTNARDARATALEL